MTAVKHHNHTEPGNCATCPVRDSAVCAGCTPRERAELERLRRYRSFAGSDYIAHQGDRLDFTASIVSGVVYIAQTLEDGRRQIQGLLLPGDFIGRHDRRYNDFDFVAATSVVLCSFDRASFAGLMARSPGLSCQLLEKAQDERDAARRWIMVLGRKTAREKIATFLLLMARIDHHDDNDHVGPVTFNMPLSQTLMADYLGLTLETVNRQLAQLRKDAVITCPNRYQITILDLARLRKLA